MNTSLKAFFSTKVSLSNISPFNLKYVLKTPISQYLTSNQGLTGWILFTGILIYRGKV